MNYGWIQIDMDESELIELATAGRANEPMVSAAVASAMRIIGINSVCSSGIGHQTFERWCRLAMHRRVSLLCH